MDPRNNRRLQSEARSITLKTYPQAQELNMSIFHAIIVILFVYLVIRSLLRGRPDPISDRLVARSAPPHRAPTVENRS